MPADTEALWRETQGLVTLQGGVFLDDSTLDKPYAKRIELVTRHWSGKHFLGINLISMVWSDGLACIPCDFRVYDKPIGGHNKNEHFRAMLASAQARGFQPDYHRGLKQCCGVEQAQVRSARAQMNHIALSIRAFVRLEVHRLQTGAEAKRSFHFHFFNYKEIYFFDEGCF